MPKDDAKDGNVLYYGDNLEILRRYLHDDSVDLVYLDPPFKSSQEYNVLFQEQDGTRAAAQIKAFNDTWRWDTGSSASFHDVVQSGGSVADAMVGLQKVIGHNDMLAYLSMMAPRLVELRRTMKDTGSIYLHCDPTASHYLKVLMDAVFGPAQFRNEIVWKRTFAHGSAKRYGPVHDVILFYTKTDEYLWTDPKQPQDPDYVEEHFRLKDDDGRLFQPITLTGSGIRHGESGKPWRGIDPTVVGRHWALPGEILEAIGITEGTVQERLDKLDAAGLVFWPEKEEGTPRLKWYADALGGKALLDVWTDVPPISAQAAERLGYPTQKPERLMERIVQASSNEGDLVLDPFCGCGTTIAVAQRFKRRWIGIDITHLAITLMKHRLKTAFGDDVFDRVKVVGEPVSVPDAKALAEDDPWQFQWWALGLVGARPTEQKKGADRGIDGRLYFFPDRTMSGNAQQIIFSVKAGGVAVSHVRDLRGVVEREKAAIGVLISMNPPTRDMREEAASAGFYTSNELTRPTYPRIQLLTVEHLLGGQKVDCPPYAAGRGNVTFRRAPESAEEDRSRTKASTIHEFDEN